MLIGVSGLAGSGKDAVAGFLGQKHGFVTVSFADPLKRFARDVYQFTEEQLWGPSEKRNAPDERYQRGWKLECGCVVRGCEKLDPPRLFRVSGLLEACCEEHDHLWWEGRTTLDEPKPEYLTPRLALQLLGTEWGRRCYDDTWVEYAIRVYERLQKGGVSYDRVTGIRFCSGIGDMMWPKINVVIPDLRFINEFNGIESAGGRCIRIVRPGAGLEGQRGQHVSETQQRSIPDERFHHVIHNKGTLEDLAELVDEAVASLG